MQLHNFRKNQKNKGKKRVGRGGKRGTYSGKGMKGQKSRAGHRIRPEIRDLLIRIPKLKGIKNKPVFKKPVSINLSVFAKIKESEISKEVLIKNKIIGKAVKSVKVLSDGEVNRPITLKNFIVSKKAKEKIEAAGGKIV